MPSGSQTSSQSKTRWQCTHEAVLAVLPVCAGGALGTPVVATSWGDTPALATRGVTSTVAALAVPVFRDGLFLGCSVCADGAPELVTPSGVPAGSGDLAMTAVRCLLRAGGWVALEGTLAGPAGGDPCPRAQNSRPDVARLSKETIMNSQH